MKIRSFVLPVLVTATLCAAGCASKAALPPPAPPSMTNAAIAPPAAPAPKTNIHVSDEILQACNIQFDNTATAPKFAFDKSELIPADWSVLEQVAACVTTGPLKGRQIKLVGRADPRGKAKYNMALGEHRSGSAGDYLAKLGVDKTKMAETSRGALDATGTDAAGWELDRRVDILLQ